MSREKKNSAFKLLVFLKNFQDSAFVRSYAVHIFFFFGGGGDSGSSDTVCAILFHCLNCLVSLKRSGTETCFGFSFRGVLKQE